MKAGDVQRRLSLTNSWWRDLTWEDADPDLGAATRSGLDYTPDPLADLVPGGLYTLRGPRRVGKSTEVKRAVSDLIHHGVEPRRIAHAAVDSYRSRDLEILIDAADTFLLPSTPETPRWWFIDEITSIKDDWPNAIKWLRDNHPTFRHDTVVVTGSSSARLDDAEKAWAGRRGPAEHCDRLLLPMSFGDFCRVTGLELPHVPRLDAAELSTPSAAAAIDALIPWLHELIVRWETYLDVGGYPAAVSGWKTDREVPASFIDSLWHAIRGEIIPDVMLTEVQTARLCAELALALTTPVSITAVANAIGITRDALATRWRHLERCYQIWPLYREDGMRPRLRARNKYYFSDPLLARIGARYAHMQPPDLTMLNEQQIGLALLRNLGRRDHVHPVAHDRMLFYRSRTNAEIDFVSPEFKTLAFESKYVDANWGRELQTIKASGWYGILATRSGIDRGPTAWALPSPVVALLLSGTHPS